MAKAIPINSTGGELIGYAIYCPACKKPHFFFKDKWSFNGDVDAPTFTPSMLLHPSRFQKRCHSFVEKGRIRYLTDCGHELRGQVIDLPDFDDEEIQ